MTYELAKQLKDAGFKQRTSDLFPEVTIGVCKHNLYGLSEGRESCNCGKEETVHIPTLEELIEACGEGLNSLDKAYDDEGNVQWYCIGVKDKETITIPSDDRLGYSTPSEAVAKLWLAIQDKNLK